jgi:prophage regulatory protein
MHRFKHGATQMRLIREAERARITGVPRSTWYLRMKQGTAPKPVPIGDQAVAWVEQEVLDWVDAQIAKREVSA